MPFPLPTNEGRRLEALRRYELLDTPAEQSFDDFTLLASCTCGTPIALIALVDSDRQWFKAKAGLDVCQTPREHAFCAHTILSSGLMVVPDATKDPRFADNPLVTSDPYICFYAGAPLIDRDGFGLGTLCVIDRTPRQLTDHQEQSLLALARQVVAQFELRRISATLAAALAEIKVLQGILPICSYCKSIRNDEGYWKSIELYMATHSDTRFSHGICPECLKVHLPDVCNEKRADSKS